jgi:signal transduction histidine kinase
MTSPTPASTYGTAAEAEALLQRAVAEMKADRTRALAKFSDADGGFRDRDLYVFCANTGDGILTAHPSIAGTDLRALKDKNGQPFGAKMLDTAVEGTTTKVSYMWPRPNSTHPVGKVTLITRVGDQICGVGYYNP